MKKLIPAVLLLLTGWCLWRWFAPPGRIVEVVQRGRVIARLDLSREKGSRTIDIRMGFGLYLSFIH